MVRGNNLKILVPLAVAASLLTVVLYQQQERRSGERFEARKLLPELDVGAIGRIEIHAGEEPVILLARGDAWSLESLPGFPINHEQLRELILALGDLEAADRMTDKPENYERLGVQAEGPSEGRIVLQDAGGQTLADLFVGDQRSGRPSTSGGFAPADGQYVRLAGDPWVYKTAELVVVPGSASQWFEKELLKVPASDLQRISVGDESSTGSFVLARGDSEDLELQGPIPEGMQVKDWAVDNVGRALANLTLTDVKPAEDSAIAFDGIYQAIQKNGLIYEVDTAAAEEKFFARIGADYDAAFNLALSDERTSDSVEAAGMEDPEAAVARLRERHGPWVYEISEFAHENLTKVRPDLLEPVREEMPAPDGLDLSGAGGDAEIEDFLSGLQGGVPGGLPAP